MDKVRTNSKFKWREFTLKAVKEIVPENVEFRTTNPKLDDRCAGCAAHKTSFSPELVICEEMPPCESTKQIYIFPDDQDRYDRLRDLMLIEKLRGDKW